MKFLNEFEDRLSLAAQSFCINSFHSVKLFDIRSCRKCLFTIPGNDDAPESILFIIVRKECFQIIKHLGIQCIKGVWAIQAKQENALVLFNGECLIVIHMVKVMNL